jgi:hypothetical protein
MIMPAQQPVVSGGWLVDIRTAVAVGGVVLPATWWLSRKFTTISDRLDAGQQQFIRIEQRLQDMEQKMK